MARVLFFLQLIVVLVVLPLWPGLDARYLGWGLVYLGFIGALPAAAVGAVYGPRALGRALADAWSVGPLGSGSEKSADCWALIVATLPVAGVLGGAVAVVGSLSEFGPEGPSVGKAAILAFFCLVWALLALLLGWVLRGIVVRLSARRPESSGSRPLLVLNPAIAARFGLTLRETDAAQAVLDGLTYRDAADRLGVGPATVKSHVLSVYQKTGAGNKIELLRLVEAENARLHQTVDGQKSGSGRF